MKFSLDSVKNADWKQLAIDHGEKIGLAVALVVAGVVLLTGRWSPYDAKQPGQVEAAVDREAEALKRSVWTADVRAQDVPDLDVEARARQLLTDLPPDSFPLPRPVTAPLYPVQEPAREPVWLAPEDVIVSTEMMLVRLTPEDAADEEDEDADGEDAEDDGDDIADEFRIAQSGGAGGGKGMGLDDGGVGDDYEKMMMGMMGDGGDGANDDSVGDDYEKQMMGMMGEGGMGMDSGPYLGDENARGRGVKVAAVRAVFPYRRQVQQLARSLGVPFADAQARLELLELQVERQRAVPGPNPWAGAWEPVDREAAEELLAEDAQTASSREIVAANATDPAITFPLLSRVYGSYAPKDDKPGSGTHPRISNLDLSVEARELQERALNRLRERDEEKRQRREEEAARRGAPKRTFGRAFDAKAAAEDLAAGEQTDEDAALLEQLKGMQFDDVLLLVRFFDVAVEPGQAYRYRVRLGVANPNFGLGPADVADIASLEGETRTTPWSEPSDPTVVPADEYLFLADTAADPTGMPEATLEVTQYARQFGTLVRDAERVHPGDLLAFEDKSAYLLDPVKGVYEKRGDYVFNTEHLVLDVFAPPADAAGLHPDLNLGNRALPPGRALVLAGTGAVNEIDAGLTPVRTQINKRVDDMRAAFSSQLVDKDKGPDKPAGGMMDGGYGMDDGMGDDYESMMGGGRRSRRGRGAAKK